MAKRTDRSAGDQLIKHGLYLEPSVDPQIRDGLSLNRPLLVFGRQSGEAVRTNSASVVSDLTEAVNALHSALGIDCRHLVPTREDLMRRLKTSTDVTVSVNLDEPSKTFKHTYVVTDLRPDGVALILLLALGSGHVLASDRNNPFIVRIADEIRDKTPLVVFAKNTSRQFRQGWGQAPLREEFAYQERLGKRVYLGTERGLTDDGIFAAANDLLEGEKNKAEAANIIKNTRRRILTRTGETPLFDPAGTPWHHSAADPPGFISLRLARTTRHAKDRYLLLDSPELLPAQIDVLDRIPQPTDADGNLADQVANVRWYLANAGREDTTLLDLNNEMLRRGFATQGLRRMQQNPHVTFATAAKNHFDPRRNAILWNLDTYETGVLVRNVTPKTITLTGAFPPDGPWAEPHDFTRIRRWLTRLDATKQPKVNYTFSGLRLTVDGAPAVLRVDGGGSNDPNELTYATHAFGTTKALPRLAGREQSEQPVRHARLHHWVLAEAILQAMIETTRHPVPPVTGAANRPTELAELDRRFRHLDQRHREIQDLYEFRQRQVDEVDAETGEPLLSQHRRKQMWAQIDALEEDIATANDELGDIRVRIGIAETRHELLVAGAEVDTLVDMIASLRNPRDRTYSETWMRAIRDLAVTYTRVNRHGARGIKTTVTFTMRLSDGATTVDVPAHWEHTSAAAGNLESLAEAMIAELRRGVTLKQLDTILGRSNVAYPDIRRKLGFTGLAPQLHCPDPDLLRLHLAVIDAMANPGRPPSAQERDHILATVKGDTWSRRFGNREVLIARILERFHGHGPTRRQYYVLVAKHEVALLKAGRAGRVVDDACMPLHQRQMARTTLRRNGRLTYWQESGVAAFRLNPCGHCGSQELVMAKMHEVTGYVCLACRRDAAGVVWDSAFDPHLLPASAVSGYRKEHPEKSLPAPAVPDGSTPGARTYGAPAFSTGLLVQPVAPEMSSEQFRRPRQKYRQRSDVGTRECRAIVRAYTEERLGLRELVARHDVASRVVREILHEAGALRPRGTQRK